MSVWALTDHDSVAALGVAATAAAQHGMRFVPGIELSVTLERKEIHVLGHFVDPESGPLRRFEDLLAEKRRTRMNGILERLSALGITLSAGEVEKFSGGKTLARPHIARALLERNLVASVKEAFDRFLAEGRPAYVGRYRLAAEEAIALVRGAGGTATVAHPGVNKLERVDVARLAGWGLCGIEVHHADHPPSLREKFLAMARDLDLVPTAGSDYHGEEVAPDRHFGDVTMSPPELERLEARRG